MFRVRAYLLRLPEGLVVRANRHVLARRVDEPHRAARPSVASSVRDLHHRHRDAHHPLPALVVEARVTCPNATDVGNVRRLERLIGSNRSRIHPMITVPRSIPCVAAPAPLSKCHQKRPSSTHPSVSPQLVHRRPSYLTVSGAVLDEVPRLKTSPADVPRG